MPHSLNELIFESLCLMCEHAAIVREAAVIRVGYDNMPARVWKSLQTVKCRI